MCRILLFVMLPVLQREERELGLDVTVRWTDKNYKFKIEKAKNALDEGIIITRQNPIYQGVDLYNWYLRTKDKFLAEDLKIMNNLIPNQERKKAVKIVNIANGQTVTYSSITEAGKSLCREFGVVDSEKKGYRVIFKRLAGKTKNPIFEGFRFEYADDETARNLCTNNNRAS